MLFNSYVFLGLFLPLTLAGYYALQWFDRRAALVWVSLASLVFYGYWDYRYLPLICGSIAFNYLVSRLIAKSSSRWPTAIGVAVNLATLGFFKYSLFLLGIAGLGQDAPALFAHLILPLGISFWTFQQIAYLLDVHSRRVVPAPIDAHAFSMLFFPHLIAGPILLYVNISRRYLRKSWKQDFLFYSLQVGLLIFAIGLFKKVVVADSLAPYAEAVFARAANVKVSPADAWIGALSYSLQLYFDFSGYSDMAYGLARIFGFRVPMNFLSPYKAVGIIDFWRRWHRSLTDFFRTYLYIPLGGNRRGLARQLGNMFFVFCVTGLWHGAGWTFVAWGVGHGLLIIVAHLWRRVSSMRLLGGLARPVLPAWLGSGISRCITLLAVVLLWVLFRADSFETAMRIYHGMAMQTDPGGRVVFPDLSNYRDVPMLLAIIGIACLTLPNTFEISRIVRRWKEHDGSSAWLRRAALGSALAGCALYIAVASLARKQATFLYYNF